MKLKDRIRGYLPVVIDVETSGFNEQTDALLEICAIILGMDEEGSFFAKTTAPEGCPDFRLDEQQPMSRPLHRKHNPYHEESVLRLERMVPGSKQFQ